MIDFLMVSTRSLKKGVVEIFPKFIIRKSADLMIRGGDFYAIWVEERQLWSTDEQDALMLIDRELDAYARENRQRFDGDVRVLHMWDAGSGMIDAWHKYCQKQMRDNFHMLDECLIFQNTETTKKDYASKKLDYPLEAGPTPAWDTLMSTLYAPEERRKIEWAIGSVVSGASRQLQKFMVLYGSAGTGKSTVLNIIQMLFKGYTSVFDAKALGSSSNSFALEAFKSNPLVAIQHDGDLSKIEDNTRLNSLVSHELMTVNEKFKSTYANRFKAFLFMGTNKPVKITDAKSGLIRRLIDVAPTGSKLAPAAYQGAMHSIPFELGPIAFHCQEVFTQAPGAYDDYIPLNMLGASNDFYNFVMDAWFTFKKEDETTLKAAWEMYKTYCEDAKVGYPYSQRAFKEELKNYFREYKERVNLSDGTRLRSYYKGFRAEKFEEEAQQERKEPAAPRLIFDGTVSAFDQQCADCPAQYASAQETPTFKWVNVRTTLKELDTSRLHYVKVPENHIVIDFDIPDENGEKSFEKNLAEASKWPATYAEVSKSGKGIHLHYIYTGDPTRLSRVYDDRIEIKVFTGDSSLRRRLTRCNSLPIATISSGLPLKEEGKTINAQQIQSEKGLRTLIKRNLNKEIHASTKSSMDFIHKILEDAHDSGLHYDVSDMRPAIVAFASGSTHNAEYCLKLVGKLAFASEEPAPPESGPDEPLIFFDCEVFPNLFLVNWKVEGEGKPVVRMINPKPKEIESLTRHRLVGFNCRRYDNHMLYGCLIGYTNEQLYRLSQRIIGGDRKAFFGEAYNLSYTDIYDFASASNKMSLKKLEIKMGIHHQELGLPWDQPVPEEMWCKVAEYCDNDVIATEAAFHYLSADWTAREILSDLAGLTVNDTTNTLTQRIIFGSDRAPQSKFCYRNMAEPVTALPADVEAFLKEAAPTMMAQRHWEANSLLPYFPGYTRGMATDLLAPDDPRLKEYKRSMISLYRNEIAGEGGFVYAEPGMHTNVALLDIASMHPHSVIAECLFGPEFTRHFKEIVDGRVSIKHESWDKVNTMLGGKLAPYIQKVQSGALTSKQLANALKTAINSVYGLTSASFDNAFHDPRNKDNIVAKRGALFMIDLKHAVQDKGFTVAHIKTDSIKIPNATPEIIQFVMDFGKRYGYTFEHEATYERMCLVNDAVYIARYATADWCQAQYGYIPDDCQKHGGAWTATGKQFQVPYVFKTLFSKEPIVFDDLCETVAASSALYLDMNEGLPEGEHAYRFIGKVGQFCPIKPGCGGGLLLREAVNTETGEKKYASTSGAKDYRWQESEVVRQLGMENSIDRSFYNKLVDDAVENMSQYGDFEWFVSDISDSEPPWKE